MGSGAGDTQSGMELLENWARWACGGEWAIIMAHYYHRNDSTCQDYRRRSELEVDDDQPNIAIPIDEREALWVEKRIRELPGQLNHAVRYWYTGRPRIERVSRQVIRGWVEHAAREIAHCKKKCWL